ncbi:MAG: PAS domain-containing protein [Anaerolineae bacterium]|nr:PAS domain-containing protein [Anaerolineae bacterium]
MTQREETPTNSNEQLREEVERLRQRLSELESRLDESQSTISSLQKSEQLYRLILENIPPVTYVNGVGNEPLNLLIYSSPQIEKIVGHTSEEFLKDPLLWVKIIHPEDQNRVMAESEHADLMGRPLDTEYRILSNNNVISWFHDESVLVKDEHNQPLYRVGILTNVTERKNAELALKKLEDIYRQAINAAGAVPYVISHDEGWKYDFIGEGISSLTGYSHEEMTAAIWDSLRLESIPRGRLANLTFEEADLLTNADHSVLWECDFHIRTRHGQKRWIADTSVKSFEEQSGKLMSIGIYQDITERKLAESAQKTLIGELEQKNAELERFTYTVSHDLKSPLVTIKGFLGMLRNDLKEGRQKQAQKDMQRIAEAAEKMGTLLSELIELAKIGRIVNPPEQVDLYKLIQDALETVDGQIRAHNITVTVSPDLPIVYADRNRLREVLENLIDNAANYMGDQPTPLIEIGKRENGTEPILYVKDNGIGIEPKFHTRIFGLFEKLSAHGEGTGIGLALVKRIIEIHGGKIWVESEGLGKGSTFCFTLPDKREQLAKETAQPVLK